MTFLFLSMYKPKLLILFTTFLFLSFYVSGQQIGPDTTKKQPVKTIFINAGLQYLSSLTYAGRRDSASVPVLLPTLTLISTKGFFISGIGYFDLNGSKSGNEGFSVTPGYVFSFDKKKEFGGAISFTKFFITNTSPIILASFNATIDGQLHYNPGNVVKITVAGSYRFDKQNQTDIVNDVELSKEIQLTTSGTNKKDGLKITPDVTFYSGTQSFSQVVNNTVTQNTGNILNPTKTVTTQTQEQVRQYKLLAASGSMQVTYAIKTWQLGFTPYLIKPYNAGQNGLYFLFTTGVSVTF